ERQQIDQAIDALRKTMEGREYKPIRKAVKLLNESTLHLAELIMDTAVQSALKDKKLSEI
ncbi:MAG: hypothetical protein JNN15_07235, partial [Blastocatellia bacterium]|nr:hypothetical protein [Blastocatellia bacterium]